jgi:hypothetical protein
MKRARDDDDDEEEEGAEAEGAGGGDALGFSVGALAAEVTAAAVDPNAFDEAAGAED